MDHSDLRLSPDSSTHIGIGLASKRGEVTTVQLPTVFPNANSTDILVQVLYAGMTPLSLWQADFNLLIPEYPHILGGSIVGKVIEIGGNVHRVKPGDMVGSIPLFSLRILCVTLILFFFEYQ
jgi:D-arabinose 1-dehydrogenase-like Zn-dependent alcohol dehydrogenase